MPGPIFKFYYYFMSRKKSTVCRNTDSGWQVWREVWPARGPEASAEALEVWQSLSGHSPGASSPSPAHPRSDAKNDAKTPQIRTRNPRALYSLYASWLTRDGYDTLARLLLALSSVSLTKGGIRGRWSDRNHRKGSPSRADRVCT